MRKNLYYHEHQLSGVWSTTLFPNDGTTVLISAASDGTVRGCITSWIAGIKKLVMKDLTFELFKVHSIINPPSEGIDLLINFPNALDDYKEEALQICKKMKASRARGLSKDDIAVKSTLHEDNLIAIDHHKTFYKLSIDSFFNISVDNAEVHVSGVRTSFNEKNYSKPTINKDSTCAIHAIDSTFFTNYSCNESDDVSQWNELNRQSRDCQLIMYGGASGLVHIQVIDPYNIFTASNADKDVAGYKL